MIEGSRLEPRHKEMGRHITSGIVNSGIVQIVKVLCQFGSIIVLSRILLPSDFGLMAMVGPVSGFVALFQDLGLSQATIQKPQLSHDEVNAFFWINVGVGAALTAVIVAISPLVGWYYGEPHVVPLTAAMGLLILLSSLGNQPGAILMRRMEFGVLALNGVVGAVSGLTVSIILALILKNYWALYFGMAVGTVIPAIGVWIASGWRPSVPRFVPGLREMLKFGAGITSANVSSFFSRNMDNVLIGWRWGNDALGLYDRAYKLLLFPIERIVGPVMGTMVPVLSRLTGEPERYRRIFLKTTSQLTLATWPGIIWAIILDDTLVPTLLGKQWTDSVAIFEPLAIAGLVQVINNATGYLYTSQGRSGEFARWSFVSGIIDVASFAIGLPYGAIGVATAYAISEYLRTPLLWWLLTRRGPVRPWDVVHAVLPQIAGGVLSALVLLGYRKLAHTPPVFLLSGGLIASYATVALTMSVSQGGRETLKQTIDAWRRILVHIRSKDSATI